MDSITSNLYWRLMLLGLVIIFATITVPFLILNEWTPLFHDFTHEFVIGYTIGGSLLLIFLFADSFDITTKPEYFLERNMDWVLSMPAISYVVIVVLLSSEPTSFASSDAVFFVSHVAATFFGLTLFLDGRRKLEITRREELLRTRRGKRSPVKKSDIRKMAENGDISRLCDILLNDINFRNRELAAELLSKSDVNSVIDCLIQALEDEESFVVLASAISLTILGRNEGREVLEKTLESGHEEDKTKVLRVLRSIDQEWAIELIERTKIG